MCIYNYNRGGFKMDKKINLKRGKSYWNELTPTELSQRVTQRYGRIEILKIEIKQLKELIEKRTGY